MMASMLLRDGVLVKYILIAPFSEIEKARSLLQNFGHGKCKTADKFWLVRRLRIFGCTGVRYCTQRENSGFTSSNMHLEIPAFG